MRSRVVAAVVVAALVSAARAGAQEHNLAERLGYPRDTRLVIIHADDIGVTHSVNAASEKALSTGLVNSGSIMIPCPWTPEIVAWARAHPEMDLGLHLTLISERPGYRWGPVAPRALVRSLLDSLGYMRQRWDSSTIADPVDVERELRAQIARAYAVGLRPTHLDSHQYRLQMNGPELFAVLVKLGREYRLPIFVSRDWFERKPYLASELGPDDIVIDHVMTLNSHTPPSAWDATYTHALETLQPGVTEFVIHPGFDDDEMRAFASDKPAWGAEWRQRDYDYFTSARFRALLARRHIQLITWREIVTRIAEREHRAPLDGPHPAP